MPESTMEDGPGPTSEAAVDVLARPEEWPPSGWNRRALAVIGASALVSVSALGRGLLLAWTDWGAPARFFLILAALMGLTVAFGATLWWPTRRRVAVRFLGDRTSGVTEVRARRSVFAALVVMTGCASALAVGAAVEVFAFNTGVPWVGLALAVAGVPCVLFLVDVALGRVRAGSLVLGPDGIRQRGWAFESYLPWVSVAEVRAVHRGCPETWVEGGGAAAWARRRTSVVCRLDGLPDVPRLEIDSRRFDIDPVLLHHTIGFYLRHPQLRGELATDRAAARIRAGRVRESDAVRSAPSDRSGPAGPPF